MNSQTHNTGTSSGIPGWGIALIVILVLALVGIGFVIVRKIVKKKHSSSSKTKGNI
jgi:flagellar basal body-associated protein FliL